MAISSLKTSTTTKDNKQTTIKYKKQMKTIKKITAIIIFLFTTAGIYAQEFYTQANAASTTNETNTITGWNSSGVPVVSVSSEGDGSSIYSIVITRGDNGSFSDGYTTVSGLTSGTSYNVVIRARSDLSNNNVGYFSAWTGIDGSVDTDITSTTYQDYVFPITTTGTSINIRAYGSRGSTLSDKIYISSISVQEVTTGGGAGSSAELNNQNNAAADPNGTEANDITGFTNSASNGIISSTTDSNTGSYAIKFERATTGSPRLYYEFDVINGQQYEIKYTGKEDAGVDARLRQFLGLTGSQQSFTETYQPFEQIVTATITGTARLEWFILSGAVGSSLYIDNLSIKAVSTADTESPTPPILSSTGQTDTTVDLSWTGATDNVGIVEYKIFKDGILEANTLENITSYQVTGLTAESYHEFTMSAIDAAGNESIISNIVAITTDASSGGGTGGNTDPNFPELNNQNNAAADPNGTEADATTGFTAENGALTSILTLSSTDGDRYAIRLEKTTANIPKLFFDFPVEAGEVYTINPNLGGTRSSFNISFTGLTAIDAEGFGGELDVTVSFNTRYAIADVTGTARVEFSIDTGDIGDVILLEELSVRKFNPAIDGYPSLWKQLGADTFFNGGNVGIGTHIPDAKLAVKGTIHAEEIRIDLSVPGPDYVFAKDYELLPLDELQAYIDANKHLPNIPAAIEMESNGVELGIMNMKLLEKIEELTLYTLAQEKKLRAQEREINTLKSLSARLAKLESILNKTNNDEK